MKRSVTCLSISILLFAFCFAASPASAEHAFIANQGRKLFRFDENGSLDWEMEIGGAPHDMHVLPNGNLLTHEGTRVVEIDLQKKERVWSFDSKSLATESAVELHSIAPLPNGQVMVALSGEGKIYEIDRDGKVHHSITLKRDHPHPHRDTRLVRPLADGGYLVAQEGDGVVREYDHDGKITWEYDVPMFGKPAQGGHGPEAFGDAVFSALRLPNGNTLIGTGNGHSILEVTPAKEIVWQVHQNDLDGITLAWVTTLEVHPNGHIVIGNCHAGEDNPQLIEIDRDKKVHWQFKDFKHLGNAVSNSQTLSATSGVIR
ncbi:outer membrane protein assembly factor BamB family protein [Stieleria varia]|uniref:Arylsulfotransferase (ASST) n=1 Tax=Stieleria varia TaxID=2528005 RepID=A0A5C6AY03_9BACT|nr:PQQ-binding-like beta-propeller repeat protein [Stieleria varia]TWU04620.1 Arylsulfotransferase (ASST) [Stieleria varia]